MLAEAAGRIWDIYWGFFSSGKTIAVLAFVGGFVVIASLLGLRGRVLSRSAITNSLTTLALVLLNLLLAPAVGFAAGKMLALYQSLGIARIPDGFWQQVPWPLTMLIAVITKDFCDYWSHRAMHTRLAWPVHAVHHSDSHVNGLTTFRVHALEVLLMMAFYILLLTWLAIPAELVAGAYIVAAIHNAYVHLEIDIDHGPFNWLLASPRFHRWHHADFPPAYGKNLANMIPLFDMLFGTYYKAGPCGERMGAERDGIPATDPVKLMLLPFRLWAEGLRKGMHAARLRLLRRQS